jgi:hypothetical protein
MTQSIESDADPDRVFELLADAHRIPDWAPAFADTVTPTPPFGWEAVKDGKAFAIRVAADHVSRSVDYLRQVAPGREGGAYLRVLPRPMGGSVIVMTIPVPPGGSRDAANSILADELARLDELAGRP